MSDSIPPDPELSPKVKRMAYILAKGTNFVLMGTFGFFFSKSPVGESHSFKVAFMWGLLFLNMSLIQDTFAPMSFGFFPPFKVVARQIIHMFLTMALTTYCGFPVMFGFQLLMIGIWIYLLEENGFFDWKFGLSSEPPKELAWHRHKSFFGT